MGLPRTTAGILPIVIVLVLIAWVVQGVSLFYLHRSCSARQHLSPWWVATSGAQLPASDSCTKVYRYQWWAVWFEFPLVLGIVGSWAGWLGSGNNVLSRYRIAWIGLLAVVTSLQMWAANVMLNLTDTFIRKQETEAEATRATAAFYGFAALSALNIVLIFILGDDGPAASAHGHEPLIGGEA